MKVTFLMETGSNEDSNVGSPFWTGLTVYQYTVYNTVYQQLFNDLP